jgi:hypothetical protein
MDSHTLGACSTIGPAVLNLKRDPAYFGLGHSSKLMLFLLGLPGE